VKPRFVALVVLLLASIAGGLLAVRAVARPAPQLDHLKSAEHLARALNLTPDQVAALEKLQAEYGNDLEDCCSRHCAARAELGEVLFSTGDTNALRDVAEKIGKARLESDMATIDHIRKVREVLTPEQQEKYEAMVTACLCEDCPSGFEHQH
jgi:Spy/CpxP family protein refolding chaperone